MLDSIKDNIFNIEEEINNKEEYKKDKEDIINKFYLIQNKIKEFKTECKNLLTDIETTKEFSYDSTYHTIEQCRSNESLNKHSNNTKILCKTLDNLSEELKETKEEKKRIIDKIKDREKKEKNKQNKELEKLKQGTETGGASNINIGLSDEELYKAVYPVERLINNKKSEDNPYSVKKQIYEKERIKKISEENATFSDETLKKARKFIQGSEGFESKAYKNRGDVWTIGYGHTKGVKEGDVITKEEAEKLYREDFKEHSDALKAVTVPLTENQKIALASFIYNNGVYAFKNSTLLKKLNSGDYEGAANEFNKWIKDGNGVQQGLISRRNKERKLFEK